MRFLKFFERATIIVICSVLLSACGGKVPGADARKISPDPRERVKQNIEQGKGFRLTNSAKNSGTFDFASSNELWRASLDTLEFMPLALANYSGGIIVTDWYSDGNNSEESVKISIRFLSNEVRSDAITVKVFYKNCGMTDNCKISDRSGDLAVEISQKILNKAAIYEKEKVGKNKPYIISNSD